MQKKYLSESLLQSRPFRYLSKEQVDYVQSFGRIIEFHNHKNILSQGKVGTGLYIILQGRANVAIRVLGEERITLAHMEEGDFFGEVNLLNSQQSTASVSAQKKTTCFHISRTCFDAFSKSAPAIRFAISKALVEDVIHRYRNIQDDVRKLLDAHNITKISLKKSTVKESKASFKDVEDLTTFRDFQELEVRDIVKNSRIISISNCSLIDQTERGGSCLVVINGAVMANIALENKRTHFAVHQPNTLICPFSFLDRKGDLFCYNTCGPATLLEIPASYLNSVWKDKLSIWYKLYDIFGTYIFDLQKNLNTTFARLTNENFF